MLWDILLDFSRHCEYGRLNKFYVNITYKKKIHESMLRIKKYRVFQKSLWKNVVGFFTEFECNSEL